jgi:hypothetical protein
MCLQHNKCNNFFVIGFLSLATLLGCKSKKNELTNIEVSDATSTVISNKKVNPQSTSTIEIDDSALTKLDQWTAFFVLEKELKKLEENKSNSFQGNKDEIENYFEELTLNTPEVFDTNAIWARFKVLETEVFLYNEYYGSEATQELTASARDNVLVAYQNLVRQINKIHEKATQTISE